MVIPFNNFKEKLQVQKELEREMIKKFGKNGRSFYKLVVLENCVFAEYKSLNIYH